MLGKQYDVDNSRLQYALSGDKYKLYSTDNGQSWQLYNLLEDPAEQHDLSFLYPSIVKRMIKHFIAWKKETKGDAKDAYINE